MGLSLDVVIRDGITYSELSKKTMEGLGLILVREDIPSLVFKEISNFKYLDIDVTISLTDSHFSLVYLDGYPYGSCNFIVSDFRNEDWWPEAIIPYSPNGLAVSISLSGKRAALSHVLSAATAYAMSKLSDSRIEDARRQWCDDSPLPPDEFVEKIRLYTHGGFIESCEACYLKMAWNRKG